MAFVIGLRFVIEFHNIIKISPVPIPFRSIHPSPPSLSIFTRISRSTTIFPVVHLKTVFRVAAEYTREGRREWKRRCWEMALTVHRPLDCWTVGEK